jgi:peptidoglycan/LPS O-acetylase OafA/YrhL
VITFRPDIEGLRAVAVLLVVLSHLRVTGFGSGFIGVDVFFVISGFLITSLLAKEARNRAETGRPRVSIIGFYMRRALRILPAALTTIGFVLLAGHEVLTRIAFTRLQADALYATFFSTNLHLIAGSANYFARGLPDSVLRNYWSLAVEEQFYLVWPLLFGTVAFIVGARSKRLNWHAAVTLLAVGIGVASLVWALKEVDIDPVRAYYSALSRAWQLALGASIALIGARYSIRSRQVRDAVGVGGLLLMAAGLALCGDGRGYPGLSALLPTLGAGAVIVAGLKEPTSNPAGRLLSHPAPRAIGRLSYSLYLWHWPLIVLAAAEYHRRSTTLEAKALLLVLSLALAVATRELVEKPFLKLSHHIGASSDPDSPKPRFKWSQLLLPMVIVSIATASIAVFARPLPELDVQRSVTGREMAPAIWQRELGRAIKYKTASPVELRAARVLMNARLSRQLGAPNLRARHDNGCKTVMTILNERDARNCSAQGRGVLDVKWPEGLNKSVVLFGNSFAGMWYYEVRRVLPRDVTMTPLIMTSCPVWQMWHTPKKDSHGNSCADHAHFVDKQIKAIRPALLIVSYPRAFPPGLQLDASIRLIRHYRDRVGRILFVGAAPNGMPFELCLANTRRTVHCDAHPKPSDWTQDDHEAKLVRKAGADHLSTQALLCVDRKCPSFIAGHPMRIDGSHLSGWATRALGWFMADAIQKSVNAAQQGK